MLAALCRHFEVETPTIPPSLDMEWIGDIQAMQIEDQIQALGGGESDIEDEFEGQFPDGL